MTSTRLPFYMLTVILHTAVYVFFVIMPFRSKWKYSAKATTLGAVLYSIIAICFQLLLFAPSSPLRNTTYAIYVAMLWVVISIFGAILLTKKQTLQVVFIIFVTFHMQSSNTIFSTILNRLGLFSHLHSYPFTNYFLSLLIVLAILSALMWYFYLKLFKRVVEADITTNWYYIVAIPILFYILSTASSFGGIQEPYAFKDLLVVALTFVCAYLSYVMCIHFLLSTYNHLKTEEKANLISVQLNMQKQQYHQLSDNMAATASMRHDFRHHVLTMLGLVDEEKYEELQQYVHSYRMEQYVEDEHALCQHSTVDVILRYYSGLAKKEHIALKIQADVPTDLPLSPTDLCIVFGNLFENAVAACAQLPLGTPRFIEILAHPQGRQLALQVRNNFGIILQDHDGFFSTKREGKGLGLSSVKNIALRQGGSFEIHVSDNIFTVEVLLNF